MVVALAATVTLWRYSYYGDVVPNTFYLKATGVDLRVRAETGLYWFCQSVAFYLAPFLLLPLAALPALLSSARAHVLLMAMMALTVLYSIWIGGDAWEWMTKFPNRYLSCVLPLLFLLAAAASEHVASHNVRRGHVAIALAAMLGLVAYAAIPSEYRLALPGHFATRQSGPLIASFFVAAGLLVALIWRPHWELRHAPSLILAGCLAMNVPAIAFAVKSGGFDVATDHFLVRKGLALKKALPADSTLGVTFAGSLCYYSRLRCVDLLGKSDRRIARMPAVESVFYPGHNKYDLDYSLNVLAPDYVDATRHDVDLAPYGYAPMNVGDFILYRRRTPREGSK